MARPDDVRAFVRDRLVPAEAQLDATGVVPPDLVDEMRRLGLFGLTLPQAFGGGGLSMAEKVAVDLELGWAAPAFAGLVALNNGLGGLPIALYGSEAQKQRWLPALAAGTLQSAFALTEEGSGSDMTAVATEALEQDGTVTVNGAKVFVTHAPAAGLFLVLARRRVGDSQRPMFSLYLAEAGTPGMSVGPAHGKMGLAGIDIADITFSDCCLPETARLGAPGDPGYRACAAVLDVARLFLAASYVGAARRMVWESVRFADSRKRGGRALTDNAMIQALLGDVQAGIEAARALVLATAARLDDGGTITAESAAAKLLATELAGKAADLAMQVMGASGYFRGSAAERFYRDVRAARIYEGTSEIQKLIVARQAFSAVRAGTY